MQSTGEPHQQRRHRGEDWGAGGGVEAIVQAMGGHPGSERVQKRGCCALANLAINTDIAVEIG